MVFSYLEQSGYAVDYAADGVTGLHLAVTNDYDLIVLDLMLPGLDGLTLCSRLRADAGRDTPVLMLTARDTLDDKVAGLDAGADDYLIKPFGVAELLARVRAVSRRQAREPGGATSVTFGEVRVDFERRQVARDGRPVHITPIEFRLLAALVTKPGKVLTHRQLLREVWGPAYVERGHYLRIYMGHLRQKLEADPARPRHFLTETGIGYRFCPP